MYGKIETIHSSDRRGRGRPRPHARRCTLFSIFALTARLAGVVYIAYACMKPRVILERKGKYNVFPRQPYCAGCTSVRIIIWRAWQVIFWITEFSSFSVLNHTPPTPAHVRELARFLISFYFRVSRALNFYRYHFWTDRRQSRGFNLGRLTEITFFCYSEYMRVKKPTQNRDRPTLEFSFTVENLEIPNTYSKNSIIRKPW